MCLQQQEAEIEALKAIFGEEDCAAGWADVKGGRWRHVSLRLRAAGVTLHAKLPPRYPADAAPQLALSTTPGEAERCTKQQLAAAAAATAARAAVPPGEEALFACAQTAAEIVEETIASAAPAAAAAAKEEGCEADAQSVPEIVAGEAVTDRKSRFVAHAAVVHSKAEADAVFARLLQDKRIAGATHNIRAFRIGRDEQRFDDGETGAGDKLLFLLDSRGERETFVVVTRWYGGVHLGNDRFKHIVGLARDLLESPQFQRLRTNNAQPQPPPAAEAATEEELEQRRRRVAASRDRLQAEYTAAQRRRAELERSTRLRALEAEADGRGGHRLGTGRLPLGAAAAAEATRFRPQSRHCSTSG